MPKIARVLIVCLAAAFSLAAHPALALDEATTRKDHDDGYTVEEILEKATGFFGETTKGLAKAVQKAFEDLGRPNAYIAGEEASGAFIVGARYGRGELERKLGPGMKVFWQGPSVGFDMGGNASKAFILIYNLESNEQLFQRIPGVEGSAYFVGGVSMNYLQSDKLILAPIRTGVGLRLGANIGYMDFTKTHSWNPF